MSVAKIEQMMNHEGHEEHEEHEGDESVRNFNIFSCVSSEFVFCLVLVPRASGLEMITR